VRTFSFMIRVLVVLLVGSTQVEKCADERAKLRNACLRRRWTNNTAMKRDTIQKLRKFGATVCSAHTTHTRTRIREVAVTGQTSFLIVHHEMAVLILLARSHKKYIPPVILIML